MSKPKRSAAQKAATAKMLAANKRAKAAKKSGRRHNPPGGAALPEGTGKGVKKARAKAKKEAKQEAAAVKQWEKAVADVAKEAKEAAAATVEAAKVEAKAIKATARQGAKKEAAKMAKKAKPAKKATKAAAKKPAKPKSANKKSKKKGGKRPPLHGNKNIIWESKAAKTRTGKARKAENAARRKNPLVTAGQMIVAAGVSGLTLAGASLLDDFIATMGNKDHPDAYTGAEAAERIGLRPGVVRLGVQFGAMGLTGAGAFLLRKYRWPATILGAMAAGFGGYAFYQAITKQALPRLLSYEPDGLGTRLLPAYNPVDQEALDAKLNPGTAGVRQLTGGQKRNRPFAGVAGAGHQCNGNCSKEQQCGVCARKIPVPEGHRAQRSLNAQGQQVVTFVPANAGVAGTPPAQRQAPAAPAAPPPAAPAAEVHLTSEEMAQARRRAMGIV